MLVGTAVQRLEDPQLLRGHGTFIDTMALPDAVHLAFVRSPIAHGVIASIDRSVAVAMPGVVGVYDASDIAIEMKGGFGVVNPHCRRFALTGERVRFVGDPVAVVAARSKAEAADAAEAVVVDYEPLASVVDAEQALAPGAPVIWGAIGSNLAAGMRSPSSLDALAGADVVVRARMVNQRIAVVPMEGNAIAAIPAVADTEAERGHCFTIYLSTQMPHGAATIAAAMFGFEPGELRVVAPHVGGGFGGKVGLVAEHAVAIELARRLQRPVKWVETRSENLLSLPHGRGQIQYVEMGFTRDGTIVGTRVRVIGDAGAYGGFGGALAMGPTYSMSQGTYRIGRVAYDVAVALTNTTPTGAFRGAGRPEAAAYLERIIDIAADELAIDPIELRRRNFLRPDEFPLRTVTGANYDSGDYDTALTAALAAAGYDELRADQARRRASGARRQLGIGVAAYVEITAGGMNSDFGSVEVHADGSATVLCGTSAHGQGHVTTYAMIVADHLDIPIERITVIQSDTAIVPRGGGTGGSRSLQIGGTAVLQAAERVLDEARQIAARLLEADPADIALRDGRLGVAGVPATALSWSEIVKAAPVEQLRHQVDFSQPGATFPFGAHVAVVEVDLETGQSELVRHIAVDDCGRIVNPMLVAGQQHGGIAQGAAQVLWEHFVYDADGNPLTSTLADYAMPSAAELPSFEVSNTQTPTPHNPLGAKGIGESGTIGSMPAVHNAIIDALSHLGIRHVDMPCTPERIWRAVRDARQGRISPIWIEPPDVFAALSERGAGPRPAAADVDV